MKKWLGSAFLSFLLSGILLAFSVIAFAVVFLLLLWLFNWLTSREQRQIAAGRRKPPTIGERLEALGCDYFAPGFGVNSRKQEIVLCVRKEFKTYHISQVRSWQTEYDTISKGGLMPTYRNTNWKFVLHLRDTTRPIFKSSVWNEAQAASLSEIMTQLSEGVLPYNPLPGHPKLEAGAIEPLGMPQPA